MNFPQDVVNPECSSNLAKTNSVLRVVFILLSMITVILLPRVSKTKLERFFKLCISQLFPVSLYVGWGGPHFGLMHLVATHIIGWIRHVLQVI